MTGPTRIVEAALPEDLELTPEMEPDAVPQPVEALQPEVLTGQAAHGHGALSFLRVFKHRNYRLFFSGQLVSLMGNWISSVSQGWLVYDLTHSPLLLGVTSFAGAAPIFFFSAFGGAIADRFDHRRMLLITQSLACAQSALLAILTLTGMIRIWEIVALALFQGFVYAFDVPIRQAMTVEMVGKEDLRHAISLNAMMFNLARVTGPPVAGILISIVGVGACFALDAVSYGAVIISLSMMAFAARPKRRHSDAIRSVILGARYVWGTRDIRISLILVSVCSAFGAAYLTLLPAFARDVLHQDSQGLGYLYGGVGAGALLGAYALARVPDRHLMATPLVAAACFGVSLIAFSQSHIFWLSLLLLTPCSFSLMLLGGATNSIVQLVSRDDMRGRVVAFYAMAFLGMMPWGSLILGFVAEHFGTSLAVTFGGFACILGAGFAWNGRRDAGQMQAV